MKFWDTIAKMWGAKVESSVCGRYAPIGGIPMDASLNEHTLALTIGGLTANATWTAEDASATINGHGVRFRDSTAFSKECRRPGFRIGLIDIERIRPMRGQSGDVRSSADTMSVFARKTWKYDVSSNPDGGTVLRVS